MQHNFVLKFHPNFPAHYSPTFPKLPPHYVPTSLTVAPHYSPPFPTLPPHSTHTPFPHCQPTPLIHLYHLSSSLFSYLFQLTSLATPNRHLKNSNGLSLGRQSKHVWLIVRQPLMKAGWWDAPLALRYLAEPVN